MISWSDLDENGHVFSPAKVVSLALYCDMIAWSDLDENGHVFSPAKVVSLA